MVSDRVGMPGVGVYMGSHQKKVDACCVARVAACPRPCYTKILFIERVLHAEVLDAERHFLGDVGKHRVVLNRAAPLQHIFVVVGMSTVLLEPLDAWGVTVRWCGGWYRVLFFSWRP